MSSCAGSGSETPPDTSSADTSDTAVETVETLASGVPDGVKFNGEVVRILNALSQSPELLSADETNGDIINDAVYKRNSDVMERLDVTLEFITASHTDIVNKIANTVQADDDEFDLITSCQYQLIKLLSQGMFLDIKDAKYIDIEKPWWPEIYINNVNLGRDRRYFVTAEIRAGSADVHVRVFLHVGFTARYEKRLRSYTLSEI